jgi:hypothetical protein
MKRQLRTVVLASALLGLVVSVGGLRAQESSDKRAQFEDVLDQANKLFDAANYRGAVERYFFASKLAQGRPDFSRTYFGMALSYYFLKDDIECQRYIRLVFEVDPGKTVSAAIYPAGFVHTFDRIRTELKIPPPEGKAAEQVEPQFKPGEPPPVTETKPQPVTTPPAETPVVSQPAAQAEIPAVKLPPKTLAGGHFEVMAFGSSWSVNLIKGLFESSIVDDFSTEMRRVITNDLRDVYHHFSLVPVSSGFENNLAFNSSGPNYGLDLRYYSSGWGGSFSIGLSFEQTRLKLAVTGTVKQVYADNSSATATVEGSAEASIFSTNLSFRWDILPSSRVSPYFLLGLGWAPFDVNITETYDGTFDRGSTHETITGTTVKALKDIADENDFNIPDAIVIFHAGFGLKVRIWEGLSGLVEAGIWDGFLLRFGVAYRI